ncbi:uncharacterized protein LOC142350793 [Convolutriloba macropyga]|uniref:uncharacterized protein LOC142350793 n=1 Tax=Convolutriloba macropyga TaxID=536237 RepID=UPI003F526E62
MGRGGGGEGGGEERNQELPPPDMSQLTRATSTIVTDGGDETSEVNESRCKNTWIDPDPPPYQFWGDSLPEYPSLSPSYQHNTPSKSRRVSAAISAQPIIIQHKIIVCDKLEDLGREQSLVRCLNCEQVIRSDVKLQSSTSAILLS